MVQGVVGDRLQQYVSSKHACFSVFKQLTEHSDRTKANRQFIRALCTYFSSAVRRTDDGSDRQSLDPLAIPVVVYILCAGVDTALVP